ncbi:hypothetical protein [Bradyrhizobium lablabi]|uniref:hypothetical protein n=1 Tax=Bradyrhizobium lablabi TaxID=722472 RepID=UPI001BA6CC98|nr:hypothetical protein [Bradyrhizobium lablabi]MBR0693621.1 hypothetical protein [Bradyrhizobium lablabi]
MADQSTFADIAVAMTLASSKLQLDLAKTKIIAERIGLSRMGYELIVPSLERDVALVMEGAELLKQMSEHEAEIRALLERKKRRSWLSALKSVAATWLL